MSIEVRNASDELEVWDQSVDRSPQATIFHRSEFLNLVGEHTGMEVHTLMGYKGQEPVGAFPIYQTSKGFVDIMYSPPPGVGAMYLGPVMLNVEKLKRRKRERRYKRFVRGCLDWVNENIDPAYVRIQGTTRFRDARPFKWAGFQAVPKYTYSLDLRREEEEIRSSVSKSLRRSIDTDPDAPVDISIGSSDEIEFIYEQVKARYDAQDRTFPLSVDFLKDVARSLSDGVYPYTARVEGEPAAGIIVLEDDDTRYYWQGGGKPDADYPLNDLLHWRIIRDGQTNGLRWYDLYGANTERLCEYKGKFNSTLQEFYEFERDSMLSKTYKTLR